MQARGKGMRVTSDKDPGKGKGKGKSRPLCEYVRFETDGPGDITTVRTPWADGSGRLSVMTGGIGSMST